MIPALLAIAVAAVALSCAGVLAPGSVYRKLHYLAPAATIAVVAVAVAIVAAEGFGPAGIKALLTAAVLFVMNPVLTHATARAARTHERGKWDR